uniref:Uncharacterized protein n=1 Tax=Cacopsylla melanoneura TaxID=428564 RepID=A0A8D8RGM8_9HEMI
MRYNILYVKIACLEWPNFVHFVSCLFLLHEKKKKNIVTNITISQYLSFCYSCKMLALSIMYTLHSSVIILIYSVLIRSINCFVFVNMLIATTATLQVSSS